MLYEVITELDALVTTRRAAQKHHFALQRRVALECGQQRLRDEARITSYNVCYTKLLREAITPQSGPLSWSVPLWLLLLIDTGESAFEGDCVITSYSIHYTKLYEA